MINFSDSLRNNKNIMIYLRNYHKEISERPTANLLFILLFKNI